MGRRIHSYESMVRTLTALMFAAVATTTAAADDPNPSPSGRQITEVASVPPTVEITPELDRQLVQLMHNTLDSAQVAYAPNMEIVPGTQDRIAALTLGSTDSAQIELASDMIYKFIGVCDNECTNLDIALLDESGRAVAQDVLPDDFPIVTIRTTYHGRFNVRVVLQECSVQPCYVGWRVLQRRP